MVKIWRVENNKGEGCYWGQPTREILKRHENNPIQFPAPLYDIGIERNQKENEICGFIDKKQALKWFSEKELFSLRVYYNFRLKQIKVKKITAIGQKQLLAIK